MDFASDIRTALADQIGRERSELWFDDTQFEQDGSQLRVLGKSQFLLDRIKRDFQDSIRRAAIAIGMIEPEISFAVGVDTNAQNIGQPREEDASSTKPATIADRTKSGDAVDTEPSHGPTAAAEPATSKRRRMLASSQPADQLRKNVTSPKGTTEAALKVLMARPGLKELMVEAIAAAAARSRELAG